MNLFKKDKTTKIPPLNERMPYNNAIAIEAIVNILERKKLIEKKELIEEVQRLAKILKNKK